MLLPVVAPTPFSDMLHRRRGEHRSAGMSKPDLQGRTPMCEMRVCRQASWQHSLLHHRTCTSSRLRNSNKLSLRGSDRLSLPGSDRLSLRGSNRLSLRGSNRLSLRGSNRLSPRMRQVLLPLIALALHVQEDWKTLQIKIRVACAQHCRLLLYVRHVLLYVRHVLLECCHVDKPLQVLPGALQTFYTPVMLHITSDNMQTTAILVNCYVFCYASAFSVLQDIAACSTGICAQIAYSANAKSPSPSTSASHCSLCCCFCCHLRLHIPLTNLRQSMTY